MKRIVVFVWFRADPARSDEILRLLGTLGSVLAARFAIEPRFGWRDEPEKNRRTWLESWEPLDAADEAAFVAALEAQAHALGLDALAQGGRFVDVFRWADEGAGNAAG